MVTDDFKMMSAGADDRAKIVGYCDLFRSALASAGIELDDLHEQNLAMTAASLFAGSLFGHLIGAGVVSDRDKRRATDAMARNFRSGIEVGKKRADRARRMVGDLQ